jgi:Flp pilus assembly pilin Flp
MSCTAFAMNPHSYHRAVGQVTRTPRHAHGGGLGTHPGRQAGTAVVEFALVSALVAAAAIGLVAVAGGWLDPLLEACLATLQTAVATGG